MYISNSRILFTLFVSALFAASMFAVPQMAEAGENIDVPKTDDVSDRLVGYWDLRDRDTFFQVTNVSGQPSEIHIQVFNVETGCAEFDYVDTLTPRDTHVYNIAELDRNNGVALSAPDLSGGHGIIAISEVDDADILTGNFRIVDDAGYEYRTNLAGESTSGNDEDDWHVSINNVDGSTLADLVIITYDTSGDSIEPTTVNVEVEMFDENENPISCSPIVAGCLPDDDNPALGNVINFGINQAVTNSRGGPSLCLGTDTTGFLTLDIDSDLLPDDTSDGAIFMGLNNGSSTGSIDHAIAD